jgi:glutamine amidotransferase
MCRFLAYKGAPVILDKLLYQPKNSLVNQSINARELEEPLNGDGFGVGWYMPDIDPDPACFVSVYPAWNNRNLRLLAPKILSPCVIAHVRAASVGDVSESNCHPFVYKNFLMMHNGGIEEFGVIKRAIRSRLSDELYNWIKGQTDSEHFYALFLSHLNKSNDFSGESIRKCLEVTITEMEDLKAEYGIAKDPSYLNLMVTDGKVLVGMRYCSDPKEEALTLYYSSGAKYVCIDGVCEMIDSKAGEEKAVLVVSEKLTDLKEDWNMIPNNYSILVKEDLAVELKPIVLTNQDVKQAAMAG